MKRLECLDGLRGVLAVYVMLGHMAPFAVLPEWLQIGVSHGGAAVDVFFILSGLVICQSLDRADGRATPFLVARAARIFPAFVPVFAIALLIQPMPCGFEYMPWIGPDNAARTICVDSWPRAWPVEVAAHLTMTNGLIPNGLLPDVWISFLGAAWSLSTEWQFYVVALLASRMGAERMAVGLLLLSAGGVAWHVSVPEAWQFSRAFLANKAQFFALGVASLGMVRAQHDSIPIYVVTLLATLAICVRHEQLGKLLPPLLWTACLAVQMRPDTAGLRWLGALLRCRRMQYLGAVSYCLYLVNEPVHKMLAFGLSRMVAGNATMFSVLWLPSAIAFPVLAAAWLHTHVEMPGRRWGHLTADALARTRLKIAGQ